MKKHLLKKVQMAFLFCCVLSMPLSVFADTTALSQIRVKRVIDDGADFLINAIERNGHFRYEIHPFSETESKDDNIVRQAGALFILGELLRVLEEGKYEQAILKSWPYFKEKIKFIETGSGEIAYLEENGRSQLGADALLLIPLLELSEKNELFAGENARYIDGLANFLLYMQKDSGGLKGDYYEDQKKYAHLLDKESDYFNGEGLLALVRLSEHYPDSRFQEAVWKSYQYFEKKYMADPQLPFYLWAMLAAKDLSEIIPGQKERFTDFAVFYSDWFLKDHSPFSSVTNNGFLMEGLGATAHLALDSERSDIRMKGRKYFGLFFRRLQQLQSWQINSQSFIINNFNGQYETRIGAQKDAYGCFVNSKKDMRCRIDYTQHALSGYRLLWEYLENK